LNPVQAGFLREEEDMSDPTASGPTPSPLAEAATGLVRDARRGILATLTSDDGYPYGSLVELLPADDGDIVLLLSRLAEHQHYIERDARASVVIAPHIFDRNAMAQPRVTLVGRVEPVADRDLFAARYVDAHPSAAGYIAFPDFQFYRLRVERVRFIAGFGQMGWIKGDVYREAMAQA
jgi:heme iron utilization protein